MTEVVGNEELRALVQAITFAHPDFGAKRVTDEIHSHGGKYAAVPLKRVRKYLQKLKSDDTPDAPTPEMLDLRNRATKAGDASGNIRLMTVGGGAAVASAPSADAEETETSDWKPVKLDEPAQKVDEYPYQAVIHMSTSDTGESETDMGELYKLQVAVGSGTSSPMLLYNKARDRKTFVHVDSPAYKPIQRLVLTQGQRGAVGGFKAFFYGRVSHDKKLVYLLTTQLAPFQQW